VIPVNTPLITEEDIEAVSRVLREGWISGEAPIVAEFEQTFAAVHGQKYGIAVPNGSLAIDLVIATMDIRPGDEIIMPTFTIISCVAEILRRGATPVFVDADPVTWNMDVSDLEPLVTEKTRAIMVVHTYGLPVDMDPVIEVADKYNLPIIEDSAEAHGLMYRDRPCGSMGFVSTFSFYANKNITTGEGGMILTSDEEFANRLRYFRNLTFNPAQRFVHEELGWNLRFTAIQAALGLSQLSRLKETILRRREVARLYREVLGGIPGVQFAPGATESGVNDYWVVGVVLDSRLHPTARQLGRDLERNGIQTRPFFFPLHKQPVYKEAPFGQGYSLPISENLYAQGLYLPNGLALTESDIYLAAEKVKEGLSH
jgi:perosamine synthetase